MTRLTGPTAIARRSRIKRVGPAVALIVALPSCGGPSIGGVASAVGGAAVSAGSAVAGAVGTAAKTAGSAVSAGASAVAGAAPNAAPAGAAPTAVGGGEALAAASAAGAANEALNERSNAQSEKTSKAIIAGMLFCLQLEREEYRIDCYADQLEQAAADIPEDADLGETRSILNETAAKLSAVVEARASRSLRPVTITSPSADGKASNRPIRAVASDQLDEAYSEAEQILVEAETRLLRAAEASERRKLAYTRVSEAVGSTRVLLRSG